MCLRIHCLKRTDKMGSMYEYTWANKQYRLSFDIFEKISAGEKMFFAGKKNDNLPAYNTYSTWKKYSLQSKHMHHISRRAEEPAEIAAVSHYSASCKKTQQHTFLSYI